MGNRLAVFAVVVLLSLQVQGGYTVQNYADGTRNLGDAVFTFGERTNSPNSDAKSVWHDCSNASAAGACDDPNSIILGYYNYDDGRNSARFHYTLNGVDAACIGTTPHSGTTPSVRMLMEFQINGPVIQNNRGWSIGADAGPGAQYPPTDFSWFYIGAYDFDDDDWDIWDAQTKYLFNSTTRGTIASTNDGTGFRSDWWDLPLDGTLRSGQSGVYHLDDGY